MIRAKPRPPPRLSAWLADRAARSETIDSRDPPRRALAHWGQQTPPSAKGAANAAPTRSDHCRPRHSHGTARQDAWPDRARPQASGQSARLLRCSYGQSSKGRYDQTMIVTRFAPSPTGYLHLGHAYAAIFAHDRARGGRFLLRLEDIDRMRTRPEFADAIVADMGWLGLDFEEPVLSQSTRFDAYRAALETLDGRGLLYPCFCTRSEIAEEIARAIEAPHGPDGPLYPGTCRALTQQDRIAKMD